MIKNQIALIALLVLSAPARAIELSLEENRGERGSVGYVDMQRLFTNSPDAQRAKDSFEGLVRQAEERVNLRKAELLKLRQELDADRAERGALAESMSKAPPPPEAPAPPSVTAPPAAAPAAPAGPAAAPTPALSPAAAAILAAPNTVSVSTPAAVAASTAPVHAPRRELALPGMSPTSAVSAAGPAAATPGPAAATPGPAAATPSPAAAVVASTRAAQAAAAPAISSATVAAAAAMFPAPAPPPAAAPAPAGPTPAQRLLELDSKIISVQADIAQKETELTHEHDDADRGLLDVESRKTDQVLARLYRAISEVARREGVSVVIDKSAILYGHKAVDLTDKVLQYLRESPAP